MYPCFQAIGAIFSLFISAGFIFIEFVTVPVFTRGNIGHDNICTHHKRFFPAHGINSLHSSGCGNIYIFHYDAQNCYNLQGKLKALHRRNK